MQAEGDDLDAIERAVKQRRVHDAELAWTSVSGSLVTCTDRVMSLL